MGKAKYIYPYLLRNLEITRPNQPGRRAVWALDISYILMKHGFMYLTAIMDLYSRYIVGWQLSSSLEKETQTELVHAKISWYGKPEIINSDQGAQYTCEHWVSTLSDLKSGSAWMVKAERPTMRISSGGSRQLNRNTSI